MLLQLLGRLEKLGRHLEGLRDRLRVLLNWQRGAQPLLPKVDFKSVIRLIRDLKSLVCELSLAPVIEGEALLLKLILLRKSGRERLDDKPFLLREQVERRLRTAGYKHLGGGTQLAEHPQVATAVQLKKSQMVPIPTTFWSFPRV